MTGFRRSVARILTGRITNSVDVPVVEQRARRRPARVPNWYGRAVMRGSSGAWARTDAARPGRHGRPQGATSRRLCRRQLGNVPNLANGGHRVERSLDHLGRACPARLVDRPRLEQLGMRKDDPELVVEPVEQDFTLGVARPRPRGGDGLGRPDAHAWDPDAVRPAGSPARTGCDASRHRVSAKMRIDPPAVRTYSTFPAEIQL